MDATPEEWRPVVGHEGSYEVSNIGRVRSLDRVVTLSNGRNRTVKGRVLKQWTVTTRRHRTGYKAVRLSRGKKYHVHVLVLEAFVGLRPPGLDACHSDDVGSNNAITNLRWGTHSSNMLDVVSRGDHWQSRKTHCPYGHEYNSENTYDRPSGRLRRECRICRKRRDRNRFVSGRRRGG